MIARRHHRHPIPVLVALGTLLVSMAAWTGAAATSADEGVPTSTAREAAIPGVTIEIDREMAEEHRIRTWVEEQARAVFERRGAPLDPDDAIHLGVHGELFDYRIRIELSRRGIPLDEEPEVLVCECGTDEMLEQVARAIDAGADRLTQAKLSEQGAGPAKLAGAVGPQPRPTPQVVPQKRRLSEMGIAGAVLTGVGGSAVAGGVVMSVLHPRSLANATNTYRNWRLPGVITLAAGGAVLAAGVSMLVVDAARCRKSDAPRRCRRRTEELGLSPVLEAGGGGLTIAGRF